MGYFEELSNEEKSHIIAIQDAAWADIRVREQLVKDIISTMDVSLKAELDANFRHKVFTAITDCVILITSEFIINQTKIENTVIDKELSSLGKLGLTESLLLVNAFISKYVDIVLDTEKRVETRLEALEYLHGQIWYQLYLLKDEIFDLSKAKNTHKAFNSKEISIIAQCLSMVVFELFMKDAEIGLLEGTFDDFFEDEPETF